MAWTNLTSGSQGSLVKASDVGRWLTTAQTNAQNMINTHCGSNWRSNYTSHNGSVRSHNSRGSGDGSHCGGNNSSVRYSGFRKCGGELISRLYSI